ncbi:HPSE [Branchiostoma lanceolatum]|uniref:HPSE protein n=1 Tax=Branchiostoma lanceolatum TaxID=7740 RepID=A0A8S4MMR1_BRALA|nr:HPSE [Branchiostoma lanceolatum]
MFIWSRYDVWKMNFRLYQNPRVSKTLALLVLLVTAVCDSASGYHGNKSYYGNKSLEKSQAKVEILTDSSLRDVDRRFLSLALGPKLIQHGTLLPLLRSERFQTLAAGLAPAFLRLGGTAEDFLIFQPTQEDISKLASGPELDICTLNKNESTKWEGLGIGANETEGKVFKNFTMSEVEWDHLNSFTRCVGYDFIFGLNVLLRNGSLWDSSNAQLLLNYTAARGFKVNWELGNEPNRLQKLSNRTVNATTLGQDFRKLRSLLSSSPAFKNSILAGPDTTRPKNKTLRFLQRFLQVAASVLDAVTWHQYYIDGRTAVLDNFTDPTLLDMLARQITAINRVVNMTAPSLPVWLGETSSAWGGGAPELSDSFVAGFMWLDKLGLAAKLSLDVVMRQSLFEANYALISKDLDPLPDYWLSLLYKQLVGSRVLKVQVTDGSEVRVTNSSEEQRTAGEMDRKSARIRVYAHCTNPNSPQRYQNGSVTLYVLNLHQDHRAAVRLGGHLAFKKVDKYLLTPHGEEGLTSRHVELNGRKLVMVDDRTLPELGPQKLPSNTTLLMPPLTFGFFVIPDAQATACM